MAADAAVVFKGHGALSYVECWEDDVPEGRVNSLHTAVLRRPDEAVVLAWVIWPDKATRDSGLQKVHDDPRLAESRERTPFDSTRMIFGGFEVIVQA